MELVIYLFEENYWLPFRVSFNVKIDFGNEDLLLSSQKAYCWKEFCIHVHELQLFGYLNLIMLALIVERLESFTCFNDKVFIIYNLLLDFVLEVFKSQFKLKCSVIWTVDNAVRFFSDVNHFISNQSGAFDVKQHFAVFLYAFNTSTFFLKANWALFSYQIRKKETFHLYKDSIFIWDSMPKCTRIMSPSFLSFWLVFQLLYFIELRRLFEAFKK